jgi:CheY-like chemotaxis protein
MSYYDAIDEPWIRWLIQDIYCQSGAKKIFNPSLNKQVILLVDDDPNLLLIEADYLDFRGLQPITAESVEEAWDYYCTVKPDVIVSGIAMQSIDCGYRLLQQVREDDLHQPFIFFSSQITIPGKRERAMELGANACFPKLFNLEELFSAIAQFFG